MATNRNVVLATGHLYHIYNRGVERRTTFTNKREYNRFLETMRYYQYMDPPVRYSKFLQLPNHLRESIVTNFITQPRIVDILCYCLMPNHFHLLLRQQNDHGISRFLANISNSYSKYFNTKHARVGPLLQGTFKAVLVETNEQLLHVSRYIHLNPVASLMSPTDTLEDYPWSSFPEYLGKSATLLAKPQVILSQFSSAAKYHEFVHDQVDYAKTLERTKHLHFEE